MFFLDLQPRVCGDVGGCGLGVVCFVLSLKLFVEGGKFVMQVVGDVVLVFVWCVV